MINENNEILVPISLGELLDRVTILELKLEMINDLSKISNVKYELKKILSYVDIDRISCGLDVKRFKYELKSINKKIWDGENLIRALELRKDFGDKFVDQARSIRLWNDERANIKRELNTLFRSTIVEEKYHDTKVGDSR